MKPALRLLLTLVTILCCTTISGASIQELQAGVAFEKTCDIEEQIGFGADFNAPKTAVPRKPGGAADSDFISDHATKHKFDPSRPSTKNRSQFGEDVDVAEVRRQTMANPDNISSDVRSRATKYEKEFGGNISTPDTPTPHSRVFVNPDPSRSTQFPLVPRR